MPWSTSFEPWPEDQLGLPDFVDDRGRFREIFCAISAERGAELPDHREREAALTRVGIEPAGTGAAVGLAPSDANLLGLMVPGVGWE
ncbi:MAG: hypothetical protein AAGH19_07675, partial [Pseudomonadota bacterium]